MLYDFSKEIETKSDPELLYIDDQRVAYGLTVNAIAEQKRFLI